MRVISISDTHELHSQVTLPTGDLLIHAGDFTNKGNMVKASEFADWFAKESAHYTYGGILIAGNHDFCMDKASSTTRIKEAEDLFKRDKVIYLNDSGYTLPNGIKVWGSPISPWFFDWAFNRQRGSDIKKHWDMIPNDTNILITHGPIMGIMDQPFNGPEHVGCQDLLDKTATLHNMKLHVCGHIHSGYGTISNNDHSTYWVNASVVNEQYKVVNKPIVLEL